MNSLNQLLDRRLDEFDWSVRTGACFLNIGLVTIRDLVRKTEAAILRAPNFGGKSLLEVKQFLVDRGLRLGMDIGEQSPRVEQLAHTYPPTLCVAKVHVCTTIPGGGRPRERREAKTRLLGIPIDQCGATARWRVLTEPLCDVHAGRRALRLLEDENGR